jgi:hypothetical protein
MNGWDLRPQNLHAPRICMLEHGIQASYHYDQYRRRYCHSKDVSALKYQKLNAVVSGHKNLCASSIYVRKTTDKISKSLVKIWRRYSSSKNSMKTNIRKSRDARSHENDSNL